MKIKTALILCAGFGKRLNPLTVEVPKPLLEINNLTLLENTINLIKNLGIEKIKLNTFYLKEKIYSFIEKKKFNLEIEIINDGIEILDTGGGIYNMMKSSPEYEQDFLVFNPDTLWNKGYLSCINKMISFYSLKPNLNTLLVVNKKNSFDQNLKGDFSFHSNDSNRLFKNIKNDYIFTGCQIINKKIISKSFQKPAYKFSILDKWNTAINLDALFGFNCQIKFYHVSDLKVYNKLLKDY